MALFQLRKLFALALCSLPCSAYALAPYCAKPESIVEKTVCSNQTLRREETLTLRIAEAIYKQLSKKEQPLFEKDFANWRTEQNRQFTSSIGDELPEGLQNKSIHDELIFGLRDYYLRKRIQLLEQKSSSRIVSRLAGQLFTQMQSKQEATHDDAVQLFAEVVEAVARQTEIADELYLGRSADLIRTYTTRQGSILVAYKTNGGGIRSDYEFYLFTPRKPGELFKLLKFDFFDEEKQSIDGEVESLGAAQFDLDSKHNKITVHDFAPANPHCESIFTYRLDKERFALDRLTKSSDCSAPSESGENEKIAKNVAPRVIYDRLNSRSTKAPRSDPSESKRSNDS